MVDWGEYTVWRKKRKEGLGENWKGVATLELDWERDVVFELNSK